MRSFARSVRPGLILGVGAMLMSVVAGPVAGTGVASRAPDSEAVVLIGGGGSVTPFVTPERSCRQGSPAGTSLTRLYTALNAAGLRTYTAPAMPGGGPVASPTSAGSSYDCGETLPARYTIDSSGSLNAGGQHLAAFLRYLANSRGVTSVHLVGYSMGGNFARAAIASLRASHSGLSIGSLSTLATGWRGVFVADIAVGDRPMSSCSGQSICERLAQAWIDTYSGTETLATSLIQSTGHYLDGTRKDRGWNYRQRGALDGIPVALFGGDYFRLSGASGDVWPNDGSVSLWSQLAEGLPTSIVPIGASRYAFPVTHSRWVTGPLGLPDSMQLQANPAVIRRLITTITSYLA